MKVVRDPRCPAHYAYDVHLLGGPPPSQVLTWRCSVCNRELGVASIGVIDMPDVAWPAGRRRNRQDTQICAMDWAFVVRHTRPAAVT